MLVDLRQLENHATISADIIIVGGGPAGITLALELEKSGKSVALLESGGFELDDETQDFYNGELTGDQNSGVHFTRLRYFGGTSNHWGGHCLPFEPIDFEAKAAIPDSGWPFDLTTLEPYYRRAHPYCDLGDYDYAVDEAYASRHGELLPLDPAQFITVKMRQSKPTRFGEKYRQQLQASKVISLYIWANVTDIVPNADGSRIERLTVQTKSGKRFTANGRLFILATGGLENARLMLNSRSLSDNGLANPHNVVGAYFMDHPSNGLGFLHPAKPLDIGLYVNGIPTPDGIDSYYTMRPSDTLIRRHGLVNATIWLTPLPADDRARAQSERADEAFNALRRIRDNPAAAFSSGADGSDICASLEGIDALAWRMIRRKLAMDRKTTDRLLIRCEAEQMPDTTNRVTLLPEKDALGLNRIALHWEPSKANIEALRRVAQLFGAECARTGIGRFELEKNFDEPYGNTSTAWHHMGTTRIHESQTKGVVDANLKVHGLGNMYVAGSSVFPTGGRSNPTLTLVALSIRLADQLKTVGS